MCLLNRRSAKATSDFSAIIYGVTLVVMIIVSHIGTFYGVNHISEQHRHNILTCSLKVTFFELVVWDFLFQPLLLSTLVKINSKVLVYLPSLEVI